MSGRRPSPLGLLLAVVLVGVTAWLSRVPYAAEPDDRALLRLSWRYQRPPGEDCRRPTAEDLAELPAHMRNPDACVSTPTPYRLTARIDGERVVDDTLQAAGARRDRPVFVYVDLPLTAGTHTIDVTFTSIEGGAGGTPPDRAGGTPPEPAGGTPSEPAESAVALSWADTLDIEPHQIVLIEYDRGTRSLVRVTQRTGLAPGRAPNDSRRMR